MRNRLTIILTLLPVLALAQSTLKLAFAGDIMMGTNYPDNSYLPSNDGAELFQDVAPIIKNADCAFGNLEGVLLDKGGNAKKCSNPKYCYAFRTPVKYVKNLTDAGFDAMSIANNHANDFGLVGRESTMNTLKQAGIHYSGQKGYCETSIFTIANVKYGFCAFGHSVNTPSINDLENAKSTIASLKAECDIVVVSFHGGAEGTKYPHVTGKTETFLGENRGNVKEFAHTCIDAGADIVYGHGPHLPRAIELYNGHLIAYSLGNFCTPYRVSLVGTLGYAPVLEANIDKKTGKFINGKINSFTQQRGIGPRIDTKNIVADNIRKLTLADFPDTRLSISDDGAISIKQ
jgi:hypothetical protein